MINPSKTDLPKIGYLYHYPRPDHPTDKFRLDIFISAVPTEHHFDVLRARLCVKVSPEKVDELVVTHPWTYEEGARFCPGVVVLEDRKGKKEEAFTFGGQLTIDEQDSHTACYLVSKAPILEITGAGSVLRSFIEELEIILAKQRASFADHQAYEKQVCTVDPFELYQACLKELLDKLEGLQHKDETHQRLVTYLHSEAHRLAVAGLLDDPVPTLNEIFS